MACEVFVARLLRLRAAFRFRLLSVRLFSRSAQAGISFWAKGCTLFLTRLLDMIAQRSVSSSRLHVTIHRF